MHINGTSTTRINGSSTTVYFYCQAPASAGQFTVPAAVLLALPAATGSLDVGNYTAPKTFSAPGIDFGLLTGANLAAKSLAYN